LGIVSWLHLWGLVVHGSDDKSEESKRDVLPLGLSHVGHVWLESGIKLIPVEEEVGVSGSIDQVNGDRGSNVGENTSKVSPVGKSLVGLHEEVLEVALLILVLNSNIEDGSPGGTISGIPDSISVARRIRVIERALNIS